MRHSFGRVKTHVSRLVGERSGTFVLWVTALPVILHLRSKRRTPHLGGASLWDFYAQMQIGDLVILSANKPRVLVVEVEGDYKWTEESPFEGDYQHQRRVVIRRDLSPEDVWTKAGGAARQNVHQTLIGCERTLTEDDL
jgi:hypothetical protein